MNAEKRKELARAIYDSVGGCADFSEVQRLIAAHDTTPSGDFEEMANNFLNDYPFLIFLTNLLKKHGYQSEVHFPDVNQIFIKENYGTIGWLMIKDNKIIEVKTYGRNKIWRIINNAEKRFRKFTYERLRGTDTQVL